MGNKFSSLQQTVLSKTDIFLLCETKINDSFPDSQFFAEGFKMYHKDRTKNGGGFLLYVNENLPGKIINSFKFKESSEIIVFESSESNKKWKKVSQTKLDDTFPVGQLCFDGYSTPYRPDRTSQGGGILLYIL